MFKVTNQTTTDLAMPNGVNLAPGKSTILENDRIDSHLRKLEARRAVSIQKTASASILRHDAPERKLFESPLKPRKPKEDKEHDNADIH